MIIEWNSGGSSAAITGDALCVIVSEAELERGSMPAAWKSRIEPLAQAGLFTGKLNQTYLLAAGDLPSHSLVILAGSGIGMPNADEIRVLAAQVSRAAFRHKISVLIIQVPELLMSKEAVTVAQMLTEGLVLGGYRRKHYKQEQPPYRGLTSVVFRTEQQTGEAVNHSWNQGIQRGLAFAEATNLARDLTNLPGNLLTPSTLAAAAIEVAERHGLPAEVLDEREMEQKGMGGLLAVGKGSVHPPRMIAIRYQGTGDWENVIGIVGKGITFDTGGISLKRAPGMEDMISDMGGAAAVLGVIDALGRLRPRVNVVMVIPAAENMPSAAAFKPGDVITSLSGRTVEVLNTDAEGRIVLGDALTYAMEWGAERIIDVATLTGAVLSILGDIATGAVTNDEPFLQELLAASRLSGEKIWPLPVYPEFREMLRSEVADIRNAAGRFGGATTAGLFIGEFAEGRPWIHLDIAGTAFLSKERGVNPKGATGVMVRTMLEYLVNFTCGTGSEQAAASTGN
ncbi:leucyl aminopeptidase [Paenibacillus tianjinensis]|uniref:Probable cytosol aminopeptidase n=1 Tax=Paenibacillus tianjinensis TaxID=2810347 RepID=A0ABX7LDB5_9BACL|nr:leucyl aminopeptidase [Paenibacillus tianjinensis]QSF46119.1 leucyl aminopeptidase [Paenibacillus tianjinensis]